MSSRGGAGLFETGINDTSEKKGKGPNSEAADKGLFLLGQAVCSAEELLDQRKAHGSARPQPPIPQYKQWGYKNPGNRL